MADIGEWEKIFERLSLCRSFKAMLFFDEIEEVFNSFFKESVFWENDALKKFTGNEIMVYEKLPYGGSGQIFPFESGGEDSVLFYPTPEALTGEAYMEYELLKNEIQENEAENSRGFTVEEQGKGYVLFEKEEDEYASYLPKITEEAFLPEKVLEKEVYEKPWNLGEINLSGEKKSELLSFFSENEKKEGVNMRVEIVNEETDYSPYDADAVTEMVAQKLYEMMSKGAEGYYL